MGGSGGATGGIGIGLVYAFFHFRDLNASVLKRSAILSGSFNALRVKTADSIPMPILSQGMVHRPCVILF